MVEMEQDPQTYRAQQENLKKRRRRRGVQVWKITNFDRKTALFNAWCFYGGNYIGIS
jgi:hypothetical protein